MESNDTDSQHSNTVNYQSSPHTGPEARQSHFQTDLFRQQAGFGSSPPLENGTSDDPISRSDDLKTQTMPSQNRFDPQNADFVRQDTSFTDGLSHPTGYSQFGHPQQQTDVGVQHSESDLSPSRQQSWHPEQQTETGFQHPHADFGSSRQPDLQENFDEIQGLSRQPGDSQQQVTVPVLEFEDLHLSQLQLVCDRNGIDWPTQTVKMGKPELIRWLEMHKGQLVLDYWELDIMQLNKLGGKRGIKPCSRFRTKSQLIQELHEYDQVNGLGGRSG